MHKYVTSSSSDGRHERSVFPRRLGLKMQSPSCHECALAVPLLNQERRDVDDANRGAHTASFSKTCFNGVNALSGVGLLSVPYALASGGWLSLILLIAIATATCYSGLLIVRFMDIDPSIRTYPDIGYYAFGSPGRMVASIFMNTELYMVVTGFLILEGDNLNDLFPDIEFRIAGMRFGGMQCFVLLSAIVILPSMLSNSMGFLSYVSAMGVLASLIILGSILWAGAVDGIGFHEKGTPINWRGISTSVSLYAFCYCAHPVFPTLYMSMTNKHQFPQVLIISFLLCTILYASLAVSGYLMFGSNIESQITLNLPTDKMSSKVAICTTLAIPLSKYALTATPVVHAIEQALPCDNKKRSLSLLIRAAMVISTVVVALCVPFFGYLMSLVGALLSSTGSILLPCLCYLKISRASHRVELESVMIVMILLMGTSVLIIGTCTSLMEIIRHL